MSVTVPVSNPNTLTYSNPGSSLVSPSLAASSSLTDTTMLSPPQTTLHRNVSPGAPQRPPSTGNAGRISVLLCFSFFTLLYIFIKKQTNKTTHNFFFQWLFLGGMLGTTDLTVPNGAGTSPVGKCGIVFVLKNSIVVSVCTIIQNLYFYFDSFWLRKSKGHSYYIAL